MIAAHIRKNEKGELEIQSVEGHCRQTAIYAEEALSSVGMGSIAYMAGMLHDLGKDKKEFDDYIRCAVENGERTGKTVNHTFAGVKYVLERYHNGSTEKCLASELIAYAIGAHHGEFDVAGEDFNGFIYRLRKDGIGYDEAIGNFFSDGDIKEETNSRMEAAVKEATVICEKLVEISSENEDTGELEFFTGMTARLILSSVIEGDRRDTAEFMGFRGVSSVVEDRHELWGRLLDNVENKIREMPICTIIDETRMTISEMCRDAARTDTGIYRLSLPTGAGKTLSSLRFALAHAKTHDKKRIIFTAPLISIIDQNAGVISSFVQDDSAVLIHHSNVVQEENDAREKADRDLLRDSWSAPIIITTLVQLLNTLFAGKTSSIRRMHALCDSVVIIDEVQTVPIKMMTIFNLSARYLSLICNTTFVLCSATQPYLEGAEHPINMGKIRTKELIPYDADIWDVFRRTQMVDKGAMHYDEVVGFIQDVLLGTESLLIVCNTKKEAQDLFQDLSTDCRYDVFHLSAAMCMQHRRDTLEMMRKAMEGIDNTYRKVVCVATQVIEAGVDISFGVVIRLVAGMDSIVQSAGRCNRNGEFDGLSDVYIIRLREEHLGALKDIRDAQNATISLTEDFKQDGEKYDNELSSAEAIDSYYRRLYNSKKKGYQDFEIGDGETIYSLLSQNPRHYGRHGREDDDTQYILGQAFKMAGENFKVFEQETTDVVVPYGNGVDIICDLQSARAMYDINVRFDLLNRIKPYTISIYEGQKSHLVNQGMVYSVLDGAVMVLADGCYNKDMGLAPGRENKDYLEVG